jgi:hypothetical protein
MRYFLFRFLFFGQMNTGYHKFYFLHLCTYLYIVYEICQLQYWVLSFKAQKAFMIYIECSFKCILKVGVEVLNAPLVNLQRKTQTTQKVRLDLNN